jgi:acetyl-CoA synthase
MAQAEGLLAKALEDKGPDQPVEFPETAYFLPVTYALTGRAVKTLADVRDALREAKELLPAKPEPDCWLPYLGPALDAGLATLLACEALEACKYVVGPDPVQGIWRGAASDVIMRERGVEFVDGTAPGFAAVTGAAPDSATAVRIARELQEKNIYVFMGGGAGGTSFAEQLEAEGVQLGWETRLVPFGPDVSSLIYALGFASRVAMAFGGVKPGQANRNLLYNKDRVFAFVLALGEVTADKYAMAAGAINYGFPVVADTDIPEILPTGVCTYEHVVANVPHDKMVEKALEVRGCKIMITKVDVPVSYGPAFEGEVIRKADVHAEFGGNKTTAFEFVTSADMDEVQEGAALPLAIWVEVAGRKMQADFEPILERQIHHLINGAEGIWHVGQRDIVWTRVSKAAYKRGFRLRHYGEILHAKLLSEYPAIVDKVQVTLITDKDEVEKRIAVARKTFDERNRRLASMTDESVDTFYSCLLCQSFAPDHVCIISPERVGLCGAYNWLDGKAAYEIDATGPNQPVAKGECLDADKGVWSGVNEYVLSNSHKTVDRVAVYSIMDSPMTSCGCFECILAYVPECNGVMVVNREFPGETPTGMKFSTLAGTVGGGQQTPGFMGCGKVYVTSPKFVSAEGGHARLVWMPKELKEMLGPDLERLFQEQGLEGFMDKVADETVATEPSEIRAHMETVGHPALTMQDMEQAVRQEGAASAGNAPAKAKAQADSAAKAKDAAAEPQEEPAKPAATAPEPAAAASGQGGTVSPQDLAALKDAVLREVKETVTREVVGEIIETLRGRFLPGEPLPQKDRPAPEGPKVTDKAPAEPAAEPQEEPAKPGPAAKAPAAAPADAGKKIADLERMPVQPQQADLAVQVVRMGDGESAVEVGGATAMPFHFFEGAMPNRPRIAMEVFDQISPKYPPVLREQYGELLHDPAAMARHCVRELGAEIVSVRLESTHPERGGKSPDTAVETVGKVLDAVDVPLIVSGHSHFESSNETMKAVAKEFQNRNLTLNWVEQDNYKTIAGAALAYGHCLVAQSPIDVNIAKQLNILLKGMDLGMDRILIDPTTGGLGYGLEYTYSVMERIRLTALNGDAALTSPMLVSPGPECAKIKEMKAGPDEFPAWGELEKRALLWELGTATSLLYAGADILIMYHPGAARELRKTIDGLMADQ